MDREGRRALQAWRLYCAAVSGTGYKQSCLPQIGLILVEISVRFCLSLLWSGEKESVQEAMIYTAVHAERGGTTQMAVVFELPTLLSRETV